MLVVQSSRSLLSLLPKQKTLPLIEDRQHFMRALASKRISALLLHHCNVFELKSQLREAHARELAIYVNMDHIDGIAADSYGLHFLSEEFHIAGVISSNPRLLAQAKAIGLETILRIFSVDSTGLDVALASVDRQDVDLLDLAPALAIPHAVAQLPRDLPFIGTGFVSTPQQVQRILRAGALGVAVSSPDLWP